MNGLNALWSWHWAGGSCCQRAARLSVSAVWLVVLAWLLSIPDAAATLTLEVGSSNGVPPFPRTNGRQIARNSDGIWVLGHDAAPNGHASIVLTASRDPAPEFAGDFHSAVVIVGASPQAVLAGMFQETRGASLVIDQQDVLHLVWQSSDPQGIWYSRCHVGGREPSAAFRQRQRWTKADDRTAGAERIDGGERAHLGDLVLGAEGRLWVLYNQNVQVSAKAVYQIQDQGHRFTRSARQPAQ